MPSKNINTNLIKVPIPSKNFTQCSKKLMCFKIIFFGKMSYKNPKMDVFFVKICDYFREDSSNIL